MDNIDYRIFGEYADRYQRNFFKKLIADMTKHMKLYYWKLGGRSYPRTGTASFFAAVTTLW